jgi:4-alpha-glucanotransferase
MQTQHQDGYKFLLDSPTGRQWAALGARRRAGVATPLFSLYSSKSVGIGEIPDLDLLVDWCAGVGLSVVQLLPMNDVGFDFAPYSAQSSFALEPMYLRLDALRGVDAGAFRAEIETLRDGFPTGRERVNYGIKAAKLNLLWEMFRSAGGAAAARGRPGSSDGARSPEMRRFVEANRYWLEDYALFKALKEKFRERGWESWDEPFRRRDPAALERFAAEHRDRVEFYRWLQWQACEQFRAAAAYAASRGVGFMGDIPFLVSRDSVDVWAHQDCFKLHLSSGAPPDMFFAAGQRWGMPPYDWPRIAERGYDYVTEKMRFAQNFYRWFRIDHVVGVFRLWTIRVDEPPESAGLKGEFDPKDEALWEDHGRRLLKVMTAATDMVPCAEDLGVVPACSYKVLKELGIPGMEVQRWTRDFAKTLDFLPPGEFRAVALATAGTHDTTSLRGWWENEIGTIDEELFKRKMKERGISYDAVRDKLFDRETSRHGRLRWRADVKDAGVIAWHLQRPEKDLADITDMWRLAHDERERFWRYAGLDGPPEAAATPRLVKATLKKANETVSILAVHLLQDWLSLGNFWDKDPWTYRINFPGTSGDWNWSLVIPIPLEDLQALPINPIIRELNESTARI